MTWSLGDFLLGVPAKPSGFPLYLCSPLFSPRSKKTEVHSPKSEVRASQRMPLQSLTQPRYYKNSESQKLKISKFWVSEVLKFCISEVLKKSPERTTVPRQAVECEARNPCKKDYTIIRVPKVRQKISRQKNYQQTTFIELFFPFANGLGQLFPRHIEK